MVSFRSQSKLATASVAGADAATETSTRRTHIVYLQYTNPASYPPIEHSSRILAGSGWNVLMLGAVPHASNTLVLPPHPSIEVKMRPYVRGRVTQRLGYAVFVAWCVTICLRRWPRVIYASDTTAALPAAIVQRLIRCKVIYHEHDSPSRSERLSILQRLLRAARRRIAITADICILPQPRRLDTFVADSERRGETLCVKNFPRLEEVSASRAPLSVARPVRFYFHGSINALRLPETILYALADASPTAVLEIAGYETIGSQGYMSAFLDRARRLGLAERVLYHGQVPHRADLLVLASEADVGLSFMPLVSDDINMRHMAGASNKPFDYLARGMMLLVSDIPEWREMFVAPGYALACDPSDVGNLTKVMRWCVTHPKEIRRMGEVGRRRILSEWNYEREFAQVKVLISDTPQGLPPIESTPGP